MDRVPERVPSVAPRASRKKIGEEIVCLGEVFGLYFETLNELRKRE